MMVSLITGKEQKVRVYLFEVFYNVSSWTGVPTGIAGEIAHHNFIFVGGIFSNCSGKDSFLPVPDAVGKTLGVVPVRNSEVGTPSWVSDCGLRNFLPFLLLLDLQSDVLEFIGIQGVELSGQFESTGIVGVKGEGNDLISVYFEASWCFHSPVILINCFGVSVPPFSGSQVVQGWKLFTEKFCGSNFTPS